MAVGTPVECGHGTVPTETPGASCHHQPQLFVMFEASVPTL